MVVEHTERKQDAHPQPTGYQDSGADIAYNLHQRNPNSIITPSAQPFPAQDQGWAFPDSEEGILAAIEKGANCLWANTILFKNHPLQISSKIPAKSPNLKIIGQPPNLVEAYDDKDLVNSWLRRTGRFDVPKSCTASPSTVEELTTLLVENALHLPIVAKPIRGRGSQGVRVCHSMSELEHHLRELGSKSILEEFLPGVEGTVTVMPPSRERPKYWAMPLVERFNHAEGIAPYSGNVAVSANSRVVKVGDLSGRDDGAAVEEVMRQCEGVAELLGVTAPVRIDVRKGGEGVQAKYAIFDVNMKPVSSIRKSCLF